MRDVRILLLADTHLGFDLPLRPRVDRRRRGHDFLANYERALAPAFAGEVDVVIHAGDVFDRSSVASTLAWQAFEPLRRIADAGIPVFVVPGNHERSRLPHLRFARHPDIHVFAEPRTFTIDVDGTRLALSGFPYERTDVRGRFGELLRQTRWSEADADVRVLCLHHCVEGATVGPADYTFTTAHDVIRISEIPAAFAVAVSGHIHRHQVLTTDLARRPAPTPVLYPGSIERTALAEIGEPKGFMIVRVGGTDVPTARWEFRELPARPMVRHEIDAAGMSVSTLTTTVDGIIGAAPPDAVLSIRVLGTLTPEHWQVISSSRLRDLQPRMNIDIVPDDRLASVRGRRREVTPAAANIGPAPAQLTLL